MPYCGISSETVTIAVLLAELEQWLAANAPRTRSLLHPPATPEQLGDLTARLGFALLPGVADLLLWHNGTTEQLGGFELAPTFWLIDADSIAKDTHSLRATAEAFDPEAWEEHWVPIGADRCGGYLIVDHNPHTDTGRTFRWEIENGEAATGSWPGLEELCTALRTALTDRTTWMGYEARIADGALRWKRARP